MNTYIRLAWTGIVKNRRLYIPYILTCTGMVTMYYIIAFLPCSSIMDIQSHADLLKQILTLGSIVIAVFALIFLFYTNSFLIRRRNREFGLYNILGMNKHNIARILFMETIIIILISITGGLFFGVALSKLAELILAAVIDTKTDYSLLVSGKALATTGIYFTAIYILIYIRNLIQIGSVSPASLLHSESYGEKPPRANRVLGILGAVLLGTAYYLALTIKSPIDAMIWFFIAVIMVIAATYMLFVAGSVLLCRILQKNKNYYYKPRHFVSVSSMVYRMKRNGAGLASICILATMVLIMISSTSCLYFGSEDCLASRYPRDITAEVMIKGFDCVESDDLDHLRTGVNEISEGQAFDGSKYDYVEAVTSGYLTDEGVLDLDASKYGYSTGLYKHVYQLHIVSLDEYNSMTDEKLTLAPDEAAIYTGKCEYAPDYIQFMGFDRYSVVRRLDSFPCSGESLVSILNIVYVVCSDFDGFVSPVAAVNDATGESMVSFAWQYGFDCSDSETEMQIYNNIVDVITSYASGSESLGNIYLNDRSENRDDFYATYGGLFFLGIMLSIVFVFGAVLIIYYKQISEGYEDIKRFDIMQKVGMTKKDIHLSINSQMLTVFLLPLLAAGMHQAFAFPLIRKLLLLFNLVNLRLLIVTTAISFLIFALFYIIVYRITSHAYYNIVSEAKE